MSVRQITARMEELVSVVLEAPLDRVRKVSLARTVRRLTTVQATPVVYVPIGV